MCSNRCHQAQHRKRASLGGVIHPQVSAAVIREVAEERWCRANLLADHRKPRFRTIPIWPMDRPPPLVAGGGNYFFQPIEIAARKLQIEAVALHARSAGDIEHAIVATAEL